MSEHEAMDTEAGERRISEDLSKFDKIKRAFLKNQEGFFEEWMMANGFPEGILLDNDSNDGNGKDVSDVERATFTEEMNSLFTSFMWDTIVHLNKEGQVPTMKRGDKPNKGMTVFTEIERGPTDYVNLIPAPSEGTEEKQTKKRVRRLYAHTDSDLSRSCSLGGAIKASSEAKELLGTLMHLRRAHLVQKGMLVANCDGKKTIKGKHITTAIGSEGITAV